MIDHRHNHKQNPHPNTSNFNEKMQTALQYIQSLEEERRKIQVFQRELPLCLELVTQAIEEWKRKLSGGNENECNFRGQSECSEQTSTDEGPILEQFIPLKRTSSSDEDEEHQSHHNLEKKNINDNKSASKKSDWLRSVQLWNQTPDPLPTKKDSPKRLSVMEVKRNGGGGGAFHPFKREKSSVGNGGGVAVQPAVPAAAASSTAETGGSSGGGGKGKKEEREGQSLRKTRRCWSPELHKRFLLALQQLGGSSVATPKQIRELMKVDGLTNDEVKSHLQKYRLHNRRPSPSTHNNNNHNNTQQPQFVVVGGIWVPPPEYAAMATTASSGDQATTGGATHTSNGIYAPIATLATPHQDSSVSGKLKQKQQHHHHKHLSSDDGGSHRRSGGAGFDSDDSPAASSSSTDTATTSPDL